jgi:hypothetical protein
VIISALALEMEKDSAYSCEHSLPGPNRYVHRVSPLPDLSRFCQQSMRRVALTT